MREGERESAISERGKEPESERKSQREREKERERKREDGTSASGHCNTLQHVAT